MSDSTVPSSAQPVTDVAVAESTPEPQPGAARSGGDYRDQLGSRRWNAAPLRNPEVDKTDPRIAVAAVLLLATLTLLIPPTIVVSGTRDRKTAAASAVASAARLSRPRADQIVSRDASIGAVVRKTRGVRRRNRKPRAAKRTSASPFHRASRRGTDNSSTAATAT